MAIVARLLPRHWDGRRLLQFLTGLALIALAFAVPTLQEPADQPAESPITVITSVDASLPAGLPVTDYSATPGARTNKTNLALAPESRAAERTTTANPAGSPTAAGWSAGSGWSADSSAAAGSPASAGPVAEMRFAAEAATQGAQAAARQAQARAHASQSGAAGPESSGTGVTHEATGLPGQAWHGGRRICLERRAAGDGATQGAHGERGPPGV